MHRDEHECDETAAKKRGTGDSRRMKETVCLSTRLLAVSSSVCAACEERERKKKKDALRY